MPPEAIAAIDRRDFLKLAGATTALSLTPGALAAPSPRVAVIIDDGDPAASSARVKWAAGALRKALAAKGAICQIVSSPSQAEGSALLVLVAGAASSMAKGFPQGASGEARRALSRLEHQNAIAGRKSINDGCFPCPGARGRKDKYRTSHLEDCPQVLQNLCTEFGKFLAAMMENGAMHSPKHALRSIGRRGNL